MDNKIQNIVEIGRNINSLISDLENFYLKNGKWEFHQNPNLYNLKSITSLNVPKLKIHTHYGNSGSDVSFFISDDNHFLEHDIERFTPPEIISKIESLKNIHPRTTKINYKYTKKVRAKLSLNKKLTRLHNLIQPIYPLISNTYNIQLGDVNKLGKIPDLSTVRIILKYNYPAIRYQIIHGLQGSLDVFEYLDRNAIFNTNGRAWIGIQVNKLDEYLPKYIKNDLEDFSSELRIKSITIKHEYEK